MTDNNTLGINYDPPDPKSLGDEVIEIKFDPVEFIAGVLEELIDNSETPYNLNVTVTMHSDGGHEVFRGPEEQANMGTDLALGVLRYFVTEALEAKDWTAEIEAAIESQVGDGRE